MLTVRSSDTHLRVISPKIFQPSTTEISLKSYDLKFLSNLLGANEFSVRDRREKTVTTYLLQHFHFLTQRGLEMHECISSVIIGSGNGFSPGLCHATTWTILFSFSIGHLGITLLWNMNQNTIIFIHKKYIIKCHLQTAGHFVLASTKKRRNDKNEIKIFLLKNPRSVKYFQCIQELRAHNEIKALWKATLLRLQT